MAANKVNQRNNNTSQPSTQFTNSQNQQSSKILPNQNPNTNPNQNANVNNNENYMYKNLWKINDKTRTVIIHNNNSHCYYLF